MNSNIEISLCMSTTKILMNIPDTSTIKRSANFLNPNDFCFGSGRIKDCLFCWEFLAWNISNLPSSFTSKIARENIFMNCDFLFMIQEIAMNDLLLHAVLNYKIHTYIISRIIRHINRASPWTIYGLISLDLLGKNYHIYLTFIFISDTFCISISL